MEGQGTPVILDYRNENGHGWSFYKNDGVLRMIGTTIEDDSKIIQKVQKFELRDDDVVIAAYAKCGTHWLWEIVSMLRAGNTEYNKKTKRVAMLGSGKFDELDELPSPRVLNSHLHFRHLPKSMMEKRIKTIFIMRNPKDVCVSYYFMLNGLQNNSFEFDGTRSEYLDLFLEGKIPGGAYADYVKDWLQVKQDHPDLPLLILFYENLKRDPVTNIKKVVDFIGLSVSDELIAEIIEACSFKKMRTADAALKEQAFNVSNFWKKGQQVVYRKGEIGDWKNWLTVAENERFDDVIQKTYDGTGIVFTYD
ncbi:sulfotransferase 1B1-like [Haliotis asinina]|uniref:sulfotransferase 1B1-like n=1 Tax=Haliotis asinina TaxID=109174 RepID=UPI003531E352